MQRWIEEAKNPWQAQTKRKALPVHSAFSSGSFKDTRRENKQVHWGNKNSTTTHWSSKTAGGKIHSNHTSLYETCPKKGTSAPLLTLPGKKTFVYGQNVGKLMGRDSTFQGMMLGRSMHSSTADSGERRSTFLEGQQELAYTNLHGHFRDFH